MRNYLIVSLLCICSACAYGQTLSANTISKFDPNVMQANVDRKTTVIGFVSTTHEASGIYFSLGDLRNTNEKCIEFNNSSGVLHLSKIKMEGTLRRTDCGRGAICTNICGNYIIEQ